MTWKYSWTLIRTKSFTDNGCKLAQNSIENLTSHWCICDTAHLWHCASVTLWQGSNIFGMKDRQWSDTMNLQFLKLLTTVTMHKCSSKRKRKHESLLKKRTNLQQVIITWACSQIYAILDGRLLSTLYKLMHKINDEIVS